MRYLTCFVVISVIVAGCSRDNSSPPNTPSSDGAKYLLAQEPAGALPVKEVRQKAKDGEDVVIVGRLGGSKEGTFSPDRVLFFIVDPGFKTCDEIPGDTCPTPWDYCCEDATVLKQGMATVKVVDDQGKTIPQNAKTFLGLKELQTIVVQGKAKKDDKGNLTVLASGIYIRKK